jgi:hypothetical protein
MDASAYFLYQGWFGIRSLPAPFQLTGLLNALHSILNSLFVTKGGLQFEGYPLPSN